jgi:methylphosphotriester-DNA--protein-cysteine methyltransferase
VTFPLDVRRGGQQGEIRPCRRCSGVADAGGETTVVANLVLAVVQQAAVRSGRGAA